MNSTKATLQESSRPKRFRNTSPEVAHFALYERINIPDEAKIEFVGNS